MAVEAAYDLAAPFYDEWKWQAFWRQAEYPIVRDIMRRFRRGRHVGLDLLDIGCGTGWYIEKLAPLLDRATGLDLSAGMLAVAQLRIGGANLLKADARATGFPSDRFDCALCLRVLSHVPNALPVFVEAARILQPGGLLIVSNVDASHDYELTRLPVGPIHIFADTFKHDREGVLNMAESVGFVPDASFAIFGDGTSVQLKRRRIPLRETPLVGWTASWRLSAQGAAAMRKSVT